MKLVKQITVRKNDQVKQCRYDSRNNILYMQNRRRDIVMTHDEFLKRLTNTIDHAKKENWTVEVRDVLEALKWGVK